MGARGRGSDEWLACESPLKSGGLRRGPLTGLLTCTLTCTVPGRHRAPTWQSEQFHSILAALAIADAFTVSSRDSLNSTPQHQQHTTRHPTRPIPQPSSPSSPPAVVEYVINGEERTHSNSVESPRLDDAAEKLYERICEETAYLPLQTAVSRQSRRQRTSHCRQLTVHGRQPTAGSLLPTAYCPQQTAYCPLRIAHCTMRCRFVCILAERERASDVSQVSFGEEGARKSAPSRCYQVDDAYQCPSVPRLPFVPHPRRAVA